MLPPLTVAGTLWTLWCASWLLAATWSSKTVARQPVGQRSLHVALVCAGGFLLSWRPVPRTWWAAPLLPSAPWLGWAAVVVLAFGFAFAWWARLHLGRLWSGTVTLKQDHTIVRSGPYGITRHPIYSGLLLAVAATALLRNEPAAFLGFGLVLAGFLVKIHQEERLLTAHFGPSYATYQAQVPALIPRPW